MTVFSPFRLKQRAVVVQFILLGAFVVILGAFFRAKSSNTMTFSSGRKIIDCAG